MATTLTLTENGGCAPFQSRSGIFAVGISISCLFIFDAAKCLIACCSCEVQITGQPKRRGTIMYLGKVFCIIGLNRCLGWQWKFWMCTDHVSHYAFCVFFLTRFENFAGKHSLKHVETPYPTQRTHEAWGGPRCHSCLFCQVIKTYVFCSILLHQRSRVECGFTPHYISPTLIEVDPHIT